MEWIGTAISFFISYWAFKINGIVFVMLIALIAATYIVIKITNKRVSTEKQPMVFPFALQLSYYIILLASFIYIGEANLLNLSETFLFFIVIAWLIISPGRGPVIILTVLHAITFAGYILQVYTASVAGFDSLVIWQTLINLAYHSLVRLVAVLTMFTGLKELGTEPTAQTTQI